MDRTRHYKLGFFEYGDIYSSRVDRRRMRTIDNEILAISKISTNGVISGWNITNGGSLYALISGGKGIVDSKLVSSNARTQLLLYPDSTNRIYAIPKSSLLNETSSLSNTLSITPVDSTSPDAPSGFLISGFGQNSVELEWNISSDEDFKDFLVYRKLSSDSLFEFIVSTTDTTYEHTDLIANTSYDFLIRSRDNSGNISVDSTILTVTTSNLSDPPSDVSSLIGSSGNQSARIEYGRSFSSAIEKYQITIKRYNASGAIVSTTVVNNGTNLFYNTVGLVNNNIYEFNVKAYNTAGLASAGISVKIIPSDSSKPIQPTALTATPSSSSILLNWTKSSTSGVTDYMMTVENNDEISEPFRIGNISSYTLSNFTSFTNGGDISDIKEGTFYKIYIASVIDTSTSSIVGSKSVVYATTSNTTAPEPVTDLSVVTGHSQATLSWNRSISDDVVSYEYRINSGSGFGSSVNIGNVDHVVIDGLTNGTSYTFEIKAKDSADILSTGVTVSDTPTADIIAPSIPTFARGYSIHPNQVNLRWNQNIEDDVSSYRVEKSTTTDSLETWMDEIEAWYLGGEVGPPPTINADIVYEYETLATVSTTQLIDTDVDANKTYRYRIYAIDDNGNISEPTPEIRVKTLATDILSRPAGLAISSSSHDVLLGWNSSSDEFDAWNIYRSTSPYEGYELIDSVTNDTVAYEDANVIADGLTTYYYRIQKIIDSVTFEVRNDGTQPANSLLIGLIITDNSGIISISDDIRVVSNLQATIEDGTGNLIVSHKHSESPSNMGSLDVLSSFTLETSDNIVYKISDSDVVGNDPDISRFIIKIDGIRSTIPFTWAGKSVVFSSIIPSGSEVIADGELKTFYIQGNINSPFSGVYAKLDGVKTTRTYSLDRQYQILSFEKSISDISPAPVVTIDVEPVNAEFLHANPSQINLSESGFIEDFTTSDFQNYISETEWDSSAATFVYINGTKTEIGYIVDSTNKRIQFIDGPIFGSESEIDPPFSDEPTVTLEVVSIQEVTGQLPSSVVDGLDASLITEDEFDLEAMPSIDHDGRIKESTSPLPIELSSDDNYAFEYDSGLGNSTTIFASGKSSGGIFLTGTSQGLLRSDDNGVTYSTEEITFSTNEIFKKIFTDSNGSVYFVGQSSVYKSVNYDSPDSDKIFKMFGLENVQAIHDIIEDFSGDMYIATDLGVYKYRQDKKSENKWEQTSLIGNITTESFSLTTMSGNRTIVGTETGIYGTINSGLTWEFIIDLNGPVYNLISAAGYIYARADKTFYVADDLQYTSPLSWTQKVTLPFVTSGTLVKGQGDAIYVGDALGLYISLDRADSFNLYDGKFNKSAKTRSIKSLDNIDGQIYFSTDNNLFRIDSNRALHLQSQFVGSVIPTVLLNGVPIEQGYTYNNNSEDGFKDNITFKIKLDESDEVSIITDYTVYYASNGGWYDLNPFAETEVRINNIVIDSSLYTIDPVDGTITFKSTITKTDVVTISVYGISFSNDGSNSHDSIENALFRESSGDSRELSEINAINALQVGLGIEHNFTTDEEITISEYGDRRKISTLNSYLKNANFHIFGRESFDRNDSTVDSIIISQQKYIDAHGYIVNDAIISPWEDIWIGTDNGIFIFNPTFASKSHLSISGVSIIYAMTIFDGTLYIATENGIYYTDDNGITINKNIGNGLPNTVYSISFISNNMVAGTSDGIFYSINTFGSNKYEDWTKATIKNLNGEEVGLTGKSYSMKFGNFLYASLDKSVLSTTNGIVWTIKYSFTQTLSINKLDYIDKILYISTTNGLWSDEGTFASDTTGVKIFPITGENDSSYEVSINGIVLDDDGMLTVATNSELLYTSVNGGNSWQASSINNINHIDKLFVIDGIVYFASSDMIYKRDIFGIYNVKNNLSSSLAFIGDYKQAQIVEDINNDIDHVRIYLEPYYDSGDFSITLSIFEADLNNNPTGSVLVASSVNAMSITRKDWYKFATPLINPPSSIAIVLSQQGGDANNFISWGYNRNNEDDGLAKYSTNNGNDWSNSSDKDFAYILCDYYDSVDVNEQLVRIRPAEEKSIMHDLIEDFSLGTFNNTVSLASNNGSIVLDFQNMVISFIIDNSGSMSWNDNEKQRIELVKNIISNFELNYPGILKYDLIEFGGQEIDSFKIFANDQGSFGHNFAGVRVVRKLLSDGFPVDENDGDIIKDGFISSVIDASISPGISYAYSLFPYDVSGNFADPHKIRIISAEPAILQNVSKIETEVKFNLDDGNDLGDRYVAITVLNPVGKNYSEIIIVRNEFRYPETSDDGEIVYEGHSPEGSHTINDTYGFTNGQTYYYSIFTKNNDGIISSPINARRTKIFVPPIIRPWEKDDTIPTPSGFDSTPPPEAINSSIIKSPNSVKLTWQIPVGANGVIILKNTFGDPTYSGQGSLVEFKTSSKIVFDGLGTVFIDRELKNDVKVYYKIITYDRYRNFSSGVSLSATPKEDDSDIIEPDPISNINYELLSQEKVKIEWTNPSKPREDLSVNYGDLVNISAIITTRDGLEIDDSIKMYFDVKSEVDPIETVQVEGESQSESEGLQPADDNQFELSTSSTITDNTLTGTINTTSRRTLINDTESIRFKIRGIAEIADESNNEPITQIVTDDLNITYNHPISISIDNIPKQLIKREVSDTDSSGNSIIKQEVKPGVYIRTDETFKARVRILINDEAPTNPQEILVQVYDIVSRNPTVRSSTVSSKIFPVASLVETDNRNITIGTTTSSYGVADIELSASDIPADVLIEVTTSFNGYTRSAFFEVIYENILNINLNGSAPIANGTDIAEQTAFVYLGPLDGDDDEKEAVPNGTVVEWSLVKTSDALSSLIESGAIKQVESTDSRPFYSTETVSGFTNGIFSKTLDGIARNVFFGPAKNIILETSSSIPAEEYELTAKVSYDGLSKEVKIPVILVPLVETSTSFGLISVVGDDTGFSASDTIWADGIDSIEVSVIADPSASLNSRVTSINDLFDPQIILNEGDIVTIESSGMDIITNFGTKKDVNRATVTSGFAKATIKAPIFVGPPVSKSDGTSIATYELIDSTTVGVPGADYPPSVPVYSSIAKTSGDGTSVTYYGGGVNGNPPNFIIFKEPLAIDHIYAIRNNKLVTNIVPDSDSVTDIVAIVSFRGENVPDGTIVNFNIGSGEITSSGQVKSLARVAGFQFIESSVRTSIENVIGPDGTEITKSVARATIAPVSNTNISDIVVQAICTYDELGTIAREMSLAAKLAVASNSGHYLNYVEVYDPSSNTWESKAPMSVSRLGLTVAGVGSNIYAIGGKNTDYLSTLESYNPVNDSWDKLEPMFDPRAYAAHIVYGGKIYVFGGINNSSSSLTTEKCEYYDPNAGTWTRIADMPFGLAFATAQAIGSDVYLLFGATSVSSVSGIGTYNTTVLKYSTTSNIWTIHDDMTISENRISPSSFVDESDRIIILGGVREIDNIEYGTADDKGAIKTTKQLEYTNEIMIYDPSVPSSSIFGNAPTARARGSVSVVGSKAYYIGGSSDKSNTINKNEHVNISTLFFDSNPLAKMITARYGFGTASYNGMIYAIGGGGSGHDSGWTNIITTLTSDEMKADGRHDIGMVIELKDDSGEYIASDVDIKLQGYIYISLPASDEEETITTPSLDILPSFIPGSGSIKTSTPDNNAVIDNYPVLYSSKELTISNGISSIVIIPRSEDIIPELSELEKSSGNTPSDPPTIGGIKDTYGAASFPRSNADGPFIIKQDISRNLYNILTEITIDNDIYFGQTDSPTILNSTGETTSDDQYFVFDDGITSQSPSPSINLFSDAMWINKIIIHNSSIASDFINTLNKMTDIGGKVPFGGSPKYDAVYSGAIRLADKDLDPSKKIIILTTDKESVSSETSLSSSIDAINHVDGDGNTPLFAINYQISDPVLLSSRLDKTDTIELEKLSHDTGGQSYSYIDSSYNDEIINKIKSDASTGVIKGTFSIIHDFEQKLFINFIRVNTINTNGTTVNIRVKGSNNGFTYSEYTDWLPSDTTNNLSDFFYRFIKYELLLTSNTFETPIVDSVVINYSDPTIGYIFSHVDELESSIKDISMVVNGRFSDRSTAEIGISHSDSSNFDRDFQSQSIPSLNKQGISIQLNRSYMDSIHTGDTEFNPNELLNTKDEIIFIADYGKWVYNENVNVYKNGVPISSSDFTAIPEEGKIILHKKISGEDMRIGLDKSLEYRVGIKVTNYSKENHVYIDEYAEMHNTGDYSNMIAVPYPSASNLSISPDPAFLDSTIKASYEFSDPENRGESQSEIKWYRNGVLVSTLNGFTSFTSSDIPERKFSRGDRWFFSVKPNNGISIGNLETSKSIIINNAPPTVSNVQLKGVLNKVTTNRAFSNSTLKLTYDFGDVDNDIESGSTITWIVNGEVLKKTSYLINTLGPKETLSNGDLALSVGNVISAIVTPSDGINIGDPITSNSITISNTPPVVKDVIINPFSPTSSSSITLDYTYIDPDVGQTDQSIIKWFINDEESDVFEGLTSLPSGSVTAGDKIYVEITPYDGFDEGRKVKSNTVYIVS